MNTICEACSSIHTTFVFLGSTNSFYAAHSYVLLDPFWPYPDLLMYLYNGLFLNSYNFALLGWHQFTPLALFPKRVDDRPIRLGIEATIRSFRGPINMLVP